LIFSSWTEQGSQTWRIRNWDWKGERLELDATRGMGREAAKLELVPRASAKAVMAGIAAARQARCEQLAQVVAQTLDAKVERAGLSPGMRRDQPGRYARIILRLPHERVAATATVAESDARNADSLFSSALLWFERLRSSPKRPPLNRLLMIVEHGLLEAARQRHVLLRPSLRERIELFTIDKDWAQVESVGSFKRSHIWKKRLARFPPVSAPAASEGVTEIISRSPANIDVVSSRHGQTLRYHGLPFARVRRVMERERVRFGIEG